MPPDVLGQVDEAFAVVMYKIQKALAQLCHAPAKPRSAVFEAALDQVARLEHFGVHVQQLAHVISGEEPAAPETLDLAASVRQNFDQWRAAGAVSSCAALASLLS